MKLFCAKGLLAAAALAIGLAGASFGASAKEYILTGVKPDKLVLIDAKARKVEKVITVPNAAPGLLTIVPSPDGKVAYSIVNRWESVSGIDLDTGKEVFRADFSTPQERVKGVFAMDISPDGKELFVFQSPVRLGLGEYEVLPTRIAVYDTSAGVGAKPVRTLPAPRQVAVAFFSKDGSKLYGLGRTIHIIDPKTGKVTGEHKTQGWDRKNFYPPDVLDVWPQYEQAGVFSSPYYTARSDMSLDDPKAYWTGILTVDLESGEYKIKDIENTEVFYFSSVVSATNKNIVYGVYNTLNKMDIAAGKPIKSVELDHSYYCINVSGNGKEVYLGGTMSNISVHDAETLEKIADIPMPGGANMALSSIRIIDR